MNRAFLTCLVLFILTVGREGRTEARDTGGLGCEFREDCYALAQKAKRHYQVGQFEEALQIYQQAYVIYEDPRLLIGVGDSQLRLGRSVLAAEAYKTYLNSGVDEPMSKLAQKASSRLHDATAAQMQSTQPKLSAPSANGPDLAATPAAPATSPSPLRQPRRESPPQRAAWRIGLGASLTILAALSLGGAIALTSLNGKPTDGACMTPDGQGLLPTCNVGYVPLIASGYVASGALVLGTVLTFSLR